MFPPQRWSTEAPGNALRHDDDRALTRTGHNKDEHLVVHCASLAIRVQVLLYFYIYTNSNKLKKQKKNKECSAATVVMMR